MFPQIEFQFPPMSASSRATHQSSSVPTSVTRLSNHTGTTFPPTSASLAGSKTVMVFTSSISPLQSSTISPAWSCLRTVEPSRENSAGSPTAKPNSFSRIEASLPSSIPNGTTQRALIGVGTPGTLGMEVSMPM